MLNQWLLNAVVALTAMAPVFSDGFEARATQEETWYSTYHDYRVVPVTDGLERPWSIAFLPGGDLLVTEKAGRLRIFRNGALLADPVAGVPNVFTTGQGGLLDVAPHPNFAENRMLYLTYAKPLGGDDSTTALFRGRLVADQLVDIEELFEAQSSGRGHYGSRIAFDGAGHVFITVGDRQASPSGDLEAHPAQNLSNHHGVVVRLNEDGSVPADNPFVGQAGALDETWSYGHRNPQGMFFDSESGHLWVTEHGPQGGDELNLVEPGKNYGWPVIGYGVNYGSGSVIHIGTHKDGMEQPKKAWVPSIATSGLAMYQGDAFPNWRGHLLSGGLSGQRVYLMGMNGTEVVHEESLVRGLGRIRDVHVGPDGFVYLAIDTSDTATPGIVRLEPVARVEIER